MHEPDRVTRAGRLGAVAAPYLTPPPSEPGRWSLGIGEGGGAAALDVSRLTLLHLTLVFARQFARSEKCFFGHPTAPVHICSLKLNCDSISSHHLSADDLDVTRAALQICPGLHSALVITHQAVAVAMNNVGGRWRGCGQHRAPGRTEHSALAPTPHCLHRATTDRAAQRR